GSRRGDRARNPDGERAAHAAWAERGGRESLRALRTLPRLLPHLLTARDRDGLPARPHPPDQVPRRGADRPVGLHRRAPRRLPRLPGLRDGVPGRGAVRRADRGGARRDRAPASRRPAETPVPLAQLRPAAPAPEGARPRGGGAPLLPGKRAPEAGARVGIAQAASRPARGVEPPPSQPPPA